MIFLSVQTLILNNIINFTTICEYINICKNPIIVIYAVRYKGLGVAISLTDSHRLI